MEKKLFTLEDVFIAYNDCIRNKKSSKDYLEYDLKYWKLDLVKLLEEVNTKTYKVWRSYCFIACKPKIREIFAANFRDRIIHHLLIGEIENYFEKRFVNNVFSCRKWKWALLGIKTLFRDLQKVDETNYYLQLDLKGFFMNIDKDILYFLVKKHLRKKNFEKYDLLKYLAKEIIYNDPVKGVEKRGKMSLYKLVWKSKSLFWKPKNKWLPIWNLTSQFFANIYLNELDNYIKRDLKTEYYYRYVDDFILLWTKNELKIKLEKIEFFLNDKLLMKLSENKTKFLPVNYDIDFIWYFIRAKKIILPRKRNINSMKEVLYQKKINDKDISKHTLSSINSHLGILRQAKTYKLREKYLKKLNDIVFIQNKWFLKLSLNSTIYNILESNKKPLKKYKEVQNQFKDYVIIVQIWCFYKIFDYQSIYFSEKTWLKLTIFNPKTKAERIMCWFHEKSLEKYIDIITDKEINSVILKQVKTYENEITREIYKILKYNNKNNIPIYTNKVINNIKINYYNDYLSKQEKKLNTKKDWLAGVKKEANKTEISKNNDISVFNVEKEFIKDFVNTDFKNKSYYELIEYIIKWKKNLKN
jgi:RNA-directed DNA polymerase